MPCPRRWRWPRRRPGVELRYNTSVDRIVLEHGTDGRVKGVHVEGSDEFIEADAVVCNPDLPVAYRTLASRSSRAPRRPPRRVFAVVHRVARRRSLPNRRRRRAPQHPLRTPVARRVPRHPPRRHAHARPVDPRHRSVDRRAHDGARRLLDAVRARAGAQPRRPRRLDGRTVAGARPTRGQGRRARLRR